MPPEEIQVQLAAISGRLDKSEERSKKRDSQIFDNEKLLRENDQMLTKIYGSLVGTKLNPLGLVDKVSDNWKRLQTLEKAVDPEKIEEMNKDISTLKRFNVVITVSLGTVVAIYTVVRHFSRYIFTK